LLFSLLLETGRCTVEGLDTEVDVGVDADMVVDANELDDKDVHDASELGKTEIKSSK
jgi:hypothetical protein